MSANRTTGGETVLMSTAHQEDIVNNIADETHNYSYCSDHSMSSPMCISPKPTTRTLIDFWSNPHESGMTMSFSQYEKNSTGMSSNSSNHKANGSLQSLNYSPETSLGSVPLHMKMLLDVTCDDEDRNEVTEATESTTENHDDLSVLHQYSATINDHDDTEGLTVANPSGEEVPRQSPELAESTEPMEEMNSVCYHHPTSTHIPATADECNDHGAAEMINVEKYVTMTAVSNQPSHDLNPTSRHMTTTGTGALTKRSTPLPPLPPNARRSNRKMVGENPASIAVITREQYIAKAIELRSKISSPPDTTTNLSASSESDIPPPMLTSAQSVPFVDTSLSTIHDEVEDSFDGAEVEQQGSPEEPTSKPEKSSLAGEVSNTGTHPFSPEREMLISDDNELDLTSIHSEDSDGYVPRNTRHHVVNIEENHLSLIQDVYIFRESIDTLHDDADGDEISEYGDNLDLVEPKDAQHQQENENGDNVLIVEDPGVISASATCIIESGGGALSNDALDTDLKEGADFGSSREYNRSNDTEHMLANVIDAAEKSILKGQEEQILLLPHQLEPSMFFDCEEYDASSQLRANESSLPLKFLTLNDPLQSPLATINDGEVYEDNEINNYDAHAATSPLSYPSEHLFTRVTPLRSNSSRVEDISTIDKITVPPLKKRVSKKKFHPRAESAEQLTELIKKEYRKRERRSSPAHMVEDVDDDELSSSVSTLEIDDEKDESTDLFWIDAFLDFVSPPEDSRSVDSDSSTSTGTGSNGVMIRNVDASMGNTIGSHTEHGSSQKQFRNKKKPPTSLTRLREWWQKELIEEVMKGNLVKPLNDGETESVDPRGSNDTVEKIVSHEFHKVLYGQKVSLLGSKQSTKEQEKPAMRMNPSDWLEALKATIESATMGSLVCGASESTIVEEEAPVQDSTFFSSPKSFDSLDDLVRELKNTKIETDPAVLRGHFQSMYNQLQQKFKDAQLFDQAAMPEETISEQNAPTINIAEKIEKNTDGPTVEVLPDDSLELILNSKSPMYSPPTSDYLQQPDEILSRRSGKSNTRVAKALAQAKAAMAQRRRAALKMNSGSTTVTFVSKGDGEASESLQTINEDADTSVALEDLDISMEEYTTPPNAITTEAEDGVRITFNNPSSFVSDLNTTDPCSIDRSIVDFADSITMDKNATVPDLSQGEERPEASVNSEFGCERNHKKPCNISTDVVKDKLDKRNVTKETVTDNSGSEDSINITSEIDQLIVSRIQTSTQGGDISLWHDMEPQVEITSASVSANESHVSSNGEYHTLESSGERQWHELSTSGPSDESTDQSVLAEKDQFTNTISNIRPSRTSSSVLRSRGSRSSNLKMMTLLASEDVAVPKPRIGFKSKAFRKAQSYVAMQTVDHNSSMSTIRSTSTCNSELPVINGKPYNAKLVRSTTGDQNTMTSKLVRNASLLSIIRKKSKKERLDDHSSDVLKATLINSTDRGSDDGTSPQGNDFDWEEFPFNTFHTFHTSKAEI